MKCFSIDLDGTLLNTNHEISHENLNVLKELKSQGHSIIINTGRAFEDVIKFDEIKDLQVPIFCINGTILYSAAQDVLFEASLPLTVCKDLIPKLRELGLWVMIYANQGGFPCRYPLIQDKTDEEIEPIFQDYNYDEIFEKENLKIYKIMAVSRRDELEKIKLATQATEGKYDLSMASSHPNNIEFTSVEANKGTALMRYQQLADIHFDEIFAFGDGGNDISQFHAATTSVAMGNAPFSVQQEADITTKTNDEDGFSYAIKHLLNL